MVRGAVDNRPVVAGLGGTPRPRSSPWRAPPQARSATGPQRAATLLRSPADGLAPSAPQVVEFGIARQFRHDQEVMR